MLESTNVDSGKSHDVFVSFADADRAWVEGYLIDVLNSAGVRWLSEAAFDIGVPRVIAFERAVTSSQRTLLIISQAYLASGWTEFTNLLAQTYGLETATWPVIPLVIEPVQLPPRLSVLYRLDATTPQLRAEAVTRLLQALRRAPPGLPSKVPCPYPGLLAFGEEDERRFFGRDRESEELLQQLRLHPFLAVIGPSGSGKSSLVSAGLVPRLRRSGLFGAGEWLVRHVRPGRAPMVRLAEALEVDDPNPAQRAITQVLARYQSANRLLLVVDQLEEVFSSTQDEVTRFFNALEQLTASGCWVVVTCRADFYPILMSSSLWPTIKAHRVEVLPLGEDGLRQAIVRPAEVAGVYVEAALVERLVADAGSEPGALPLVQETLVLLWEHLERRFLPLAAYEALVLSERSYRPAIQGDGRAMPTTPVRGIQVALARHADAAVADLQPDDQTIARRVLLRLVQFGEGRSDTRRQQTFEELRSVNDPPGVLEATVRFLADRRLLTISSDEAAAKQLVDLAHEALITGWPRLGQWIEERQSAEQTRRRLDAQASEWQRLGSGRGGLLDEVELAEAERWLSSAAATDLGYDQRVSNLVVASRSVIEQSKIEQQAAQQRELDAARELAQAQSSAARRLRRRAWLLGVVATLAFGLLIFAIVQQQQASTEVVVRTYAEQTAVAERNRATENEQLASDRERQATSAQATAVVARDAAQAQTRLAVSRDLTARARSALNEQPDLGLLLSLASVQVADNLETRSGLFTNVEQNPYLVTVIHTHKGQVNDLAWSPHGDEFAAADDDGAVRFWDTATWQENLPELNTQAQAVAWSADGSLLASIDASASGGPGAVRLWDATTRAQTGQPLVTDASAIAWSPALSKLAVATSDGAISLWDPSTRQRVAELPGHHTRQVVQIAWSRDGARLASVDYGGTAQVWNSSDGQPIGSPIQLPGGFATSVAFETDSNILAFGIFDDVESGAMGAMLWDIGAHAQIGTTLSAAYSGVERPAARFIGVAFNPDGSLLATGDSDGALLLWNTANRHLVEQPFFPHNRLAIRAISFNSDGSLLASAGADGTVIVWRPSGNRLDAGGDATAFWSADGTRLATLTSYDGTVQVWDAATRRHLGPALTKDVSSTDWMADGRLITVGAHDHMALLWDVNTNPPSRSVVATSVTSVARSPDGRLVMIDANGQFRFFDTTAGQLIGSPFASLDSDPRLGESVYALSPSGDRLGIVQLLGNTGNLQLWDVNSAHQITPRLTDGIRTFDWSPTGDRVAVVWISSTRNVADTELQIWDTTTGQQVGGPVTRDVENVGWSKLGFLVTSSGYGVVRFWDPSDGWHQIGPELIRSQGALPSFSPDGVQVALPDTSGGVRLSVLGIEAWTKTACNVAHRNLTRDEWQQYVGDVADFVPLCDRWPLN